MSSLTRFKNFCNDDGLELVVDTDTGLAYASERAIIRMLGAPRATVQRHLNSGSYEGVINAKIQTPGGLQGGSLFPALVVFKLALKFNLELAEAMGAAGANVYMLGIAGHQTVVQPEPIDKNWLTTRTEGKRDRRTLTDLLQAAGATSKDYADVTNAAYIHITGKTAAELKHDRGATKKQSARDVLTRRELIAIQLIEASIAVKLPGTPNLRSIRSETYYTSEAIAHALVA